MNTAFPAGTVRRGKRRGPYVIMFLIIMMASAAVVAWWAQEKLPNSAKAVPAYLSVSQPLMYEGEWTGEEVLGQGEGLQIPLSVGRKLMGDGIFYEETTDSVVLTSKDRVLHFKVGQLDATMNRKPVSLQFAAVKKDGEVYLPLAPLQELFGYRAEKDAGTGIVTLLAPGLAVQRAQIPDEWEKGAQLRDGPDPSFPIVEDLSPGTGLRIWGESEGWYRAQSASGHLGYLAKEDAVLQSVETTTAAPEPAEPFVAWKAAGQRINLVWEAVYAAPANAAKIGELPGINVVSPTWFELMDGKGTIRSKADGSYVEWYRSRGVQVWALFANSFDPERTEQALGSYESRLEMIRQLLAYAKTFKLQGINLDFENVKTSDKDNLVQFVREFTPLAHEQNLVVSIDVTPKSNSEFWSLFLDRGRLGQIVDFMMVMAYDEHWASSPVAGSVSSLAWAERSVERILTEDGVPPHKLILGVPLYTRMWTETPAEGGVKVTSKTMSMDAVAALIAEKKLKPVFSEETGQHYLEFKEDGAVRKIWVEDALSVESRMKLAKKYGLAGVAAWARSFASPGIWDVMDRHLQSRP